MKNLVLFTDGFPWDPGETPFVYNELCELSKSFNVTIIAYTRKQFADKDICIDLPQNVTAKRYIIKDIGRKNTICNLPGVLTTKAYKSELAQIKGDSHYKEMRKEAVEYIIRAKLFKKWICDNISLDEVDVFYTYWSSFATLALSMLKEKNPYMKIVTRMHGYDLYDERTHFGRQYYKTYTDNLVDKICFISEHGMAFYKQRYAGSDDSKYVLHKIGVKAAGNVPVKAEKEDTLSIVSCSSVIPLKRVEMIAQAIAKIDDVKIKWVHIGTGSEYDNIKKLCEKELDGKPNITYELLGYMSNELVREFYDKEFFDCFITTSSTEGSPVSIQEALAYGMIIVGTDVGDVASLICGNGYLMDKNPSLGEVVKAILCVSRLDEKETSKLRENAYQKWKTQYDAIMNANEFISLLESL